MSMSSPRRGRPGYDRQRVMAIAVAAFNEHGYDATSMGMLADRLGLSKSAIYHHFASKEEILGAALDAALSALEGVLEDPAPDAAGAPAPAGPAAVPVGAAAPGGTAGARAAGPLPARAVDRLERVLRHAVHVLVERLPEVTLLLRVRGNTRVERDAVARRRAFDRAVTELVQEAQSEGSLRSDISPRVTERLLFGMVNSIVEWYRPNGPEDAATLADDVATIALEGLRMPTSNRVEELLPRR
ncbi:TetR/AcrR family transcriptional regulator [Agromyces archimandritae]|uniref:TetR family transcriptional regulator n=1 Tax=Agromyces archimandritae TaxID=2781962 RepID=A0A975FQA2_9MICO|nr:TetR/AcrR family transcriptional regulator [Agromyces archimandritae]QTX05728.1 TetR family transcriptional regulator [Agromyces archimandritae]